MKRLITCMVVAVLFSGGVSLFGQTAFREGISSGGNFSLRDGLTGGTGEVSFPLYTGDMCFVRGDILLGGYGGNHELYGGTGVASAGLKLRVGGKSISGDLLFRGYGFAGALYDLIFGSVGLSTGTSILGGGGFEMQFTPGTSVFWEFGGIVNIPCTGNISSASVTGGPLIGFGAKTYF